MPSLKPLGTIAFVFVAAAGQAQTSRSVCDAYTSAGAGVAILDFSADTATRFGRTLSDLLTARLPGVSVMHSSGMAGSGSRVRLRGIGGVLVPAQPLLYVDGIRTDGELQSIVLNAGGQAPSALDHFTVDDIECVAVMRGPATTARYGTDASSGVIHVVTRRGAVDSARVRVSLEAGATSNATEYPANFGTEQPNPYGGCPRASAVLGLCTAGPVRSFRPMEADSPFRVAPSLHSAFHASLLRGAHGTLDVSGRGTVDDGPFRRNTNRSYGAAAHGTWQPMRSVRLEAESWLSSGYTSLPLAGGGSASIIGYALFGASADDPVRRGYLEVPLSVLEELGVDQRVRRLGGVARVRWTPGSWLSVTGIAGREDSRVRDAASDPTWIFSELPAIYPPRVSATGERRTQRTTLATTAQLSYGPRLARFSTEIGGEYLDDTRRRTDLFVDTSSPALTSWSFLAHERAVLSGLVKQSAVFADRIRVGAGVRRDTFKRGYSRVDDPTYPFGGAAVDFVRSDERPNRVISSLTVRAAYGESGDQRPFESALELRYAIPVAVRPGVGLTVPRNVERTKETEAGIDLGLLRDRVRLGATYFNARTAEALTPTSEFGTSGGFTVVTADGTWHNRGMEISLHAQVVETPTAKAALDVTFTNIDNEVLRSGLDTVFGRYTLSLPGYPISGFWGLPFTVSDANGDGVIVPAEVTIDPAKRYLGSATPTREIGVIPSVKLGKSVLLSALIDYRGGFSTLNLTGFIRCGYRCPSIYLPNASFFDQARSLRGAETLSGWVEDASFVKLREVTVSWNAPASWGRRIGIGAPKFTIAGRNLLTLTDYSGLDPETSSMGQSTIDQRESFTPPLARTVTLRLDLGW